MNVNNLLEGSNPFQVFQNQANKLASKWGKSGLLEGRSLKTDTDKNNMAVLLENQAKQLVLEANQTGTGASFSAGNSEAWAGVALPLVRRVFGEIVAKDLISVQPMNLPSGLIFYLDFRYGNAQSPFTVGESMYGATADMKKTSDDTTRVGGRGLGLYGAGRFGYSINETSSTMQHGALAVGKYASASAEYDGIMNLDTEFSSSVAGNGSTFGAAVSVTEDTIYTVQVQTASLADFDPEGVRAFTLSGSALVHYYPQFTRINGGNVEFLVSSSAATSLNDLVVTFQKGPDNLDDRGDFEDQLPAGSGAVSTLDIPEINVQLRSDTVTAKTRKLKAQWTPEFAQDLNAYHSIDAEAELTSILSEYISMEIDLEVLDMLIRNADTSAFWSAKVATEVTDAGVATTDGTGVYYTKMSWYQTLGVKLEKVSNLIHQKTLRGGANWMVVSPKISTILESIPGFAADSPGDKDKYNMGVQKVGAVNNRWTVYKNPYLTENIILMGYKGSQFLETGAVFAPYIPLIMTPLVYDPASFTPKKGIMTRYAKKMVRPDFYGKVYIRDLDTV